MYITYLSDGGTNDAGTGGLDGGDADSDSDTDSETETDTGEPDAGSDAGDMGCLEGDYTITNSLEALLLQPYTCITGGLRVQAPGLTSLDLPNLEVVEGDLQIIGNGSLPSFSLSNLVSVGGLNHIMYNDVLTSFDLGSLISLAGELVVYDNVVLPDCVACDLLGQLTSGPASVSVFNNFEDSCSPVPTNCP